MKTGSVIGVVSILAAAAGFVLYTTTMKQADEPLNASGALDPTAGIATTGAAATPSQPKDDGNMQAAASPDAPKTAATNMLPDVSLKNRAGEMQSLKSWPGKSMIVNFWATWCGPCRKEIPLLKEISTGEAGFQVVGIAIDFRDDVIKYADEIKINYPLLIGEQDGLAAADAFGVTGAGLPFTAFTDNQGRVVAMLMGELTREKADIILGNVRRVNKGELTPEAARSTITMKLAEMKQKTA